MKRFRISALVVSGTPTQFGDSLTSPSGTTIRRERLSRAFTLIELLVVVAITAIMMTLIVVPLYQSFNLTRSAQGWAQAQDKARTLTERISREISQSANVLENTGTLGELDIVVPVPGGVGGGLNGYETTHQWVREAIFNAKIDLIKPAAGDATLFFGGALVNPSTGMGDPTLQAPKGQPNLPASQGLTDVRYFVGLRDPLRTDGSGLYAGYVEPYSGLMEQPNGQRDNLYVLYRAEVPAMIWSAKQQKYVVNKAFFFDNGRNPATRQTGPRYNDPHFFDPAAVGNDDPILGGGGNYYNADGTPNYTVADPDGTPDPTKAQMVQNWMRVAVIQTEVDHFDMIQPVYDLSTRKVQMVNGKPRLMTLIQFTPGHVGSEPAEGQMAVRIGQESDSSSSLASDVFRTKYAGWANSFLNFQPAGYLPTVASEVGLHASSSPGYDVWTWDPANEGPGDPNANSIPQLPDPMLLDDFYYRDSLRNGIRAALSRSMTAADVSDIASTRVDWLHNAAARQSFTGFFADPNRGRVTFSYGINEIGIVSTSAPFLPIPLPDPINNPNNLPSVLTWPDNTPALGVTADAANDVAGVFSDPQYSSINKKYNKIWVDFPNLHGTIQRFIDLRETPNSDGAPSPLNPNPMQGFARAYITPGSDVVYGPDQNIGPNYGLMVRYSRTTHEPGPNQYRINYTDLQEPNYSLLGFAGVPPANYTPTDFLSAVIQPRYKVGYIQLDSDPNDPIPTGSIQVFYRFQFSRPNDAIVVDYDSRQLMTVQMTIRNYPQSTLPNPQTVTLHSTASVRNFLR